MFFNGRRVSFRGGFTLMELLVVIAIIALLVSILMPSLQAAKSLARLAVCQSNMHTIALANGMYMGDFNGFSVHGFEDWESRDLNTPPSNHDTGYGLPLYPIAIFDDDYGDCRRGETPPYPSTGDRNEMNKGGQNIAGVGQLMYEKFLEESAGAIGCPQADFVEVTPFTGNSWGASPKQNFQYVKELMGYPKLDPDKNYSGGGLNDPNTDPNAYWRNDFYSGTNDHGWTGKRYSSNYIVRGPMFRTGDILNFGGGKVQWRGSLPGNLRSKPDAEIAIFTDHEWAAYELSQMEDFGVLLSLGYDKPAWMYFPRRHTSGPVIAYTDGHVAVFQDENRRRTWNHEGKFGNNWTNVYGNGWAMLAHIYDTP